MWQQSVYEFARTDHEPAFPLTSDLKTHEQGLDWIRTLLPADREHEIQALLRDERDEFWDSRPS
jgi:hypothetical protein